MYILRTTAADLLDVRFAISPTWELNSVVRLLSYETGARWHLPWLEALRPALPPSIRYLHAVQPPRGSTPDFISPIPTSATATLAEEVARVAAAPVARVAAELRTTREDHVDEARRATLDELIADPASARHRVAEAQLEAWDVLLAADWPRVRGLLEADVAHHAGRLAAVGLRGLVGELHPDVRFAGDEVQVRWQRPQADGERDVAGAGIVLLPSAFVWPHAIAVLDPPWQPTVVYPARGVGALWEQRPDASAALAGVLGDTRARLLADLADPASTTALAARQGLAASTLSRHLQLLEAAGLVSSRRDRREVLYRRSALGSALVEQARTQPLHGSDTAG